MSKFVGTGPSFYKKKEFTGPRSHKGRETLVYGIQGKVCKLDFIIGIYF